MLFTNISLSFAYFKQQSNNVDSFYSRKWTNEANSLFKPTTSDNGQNVLRLFINIQTFPLLNIILWKKEEIRTTLLPLLRKCSHVKAAKEPHRSTLRSFLYLPFQNQNTAFGLEKWKFEYKNAILTKWYAVFLGMP